MTRPVLNHMDVKAAKDVARSMPPLTPEQRSILLALYGKTRRASSRARQAA